MGEGMEDVQQVVDYRAGDRIGTLGLEEQKSR